MEVNKAKRLRELEAENRSLKELVADLSLDNKILNEIVSKNWSNLPPKGRKQNSSAKALHKPEDVYITERLGILASK